LSNQLAALVEQLESVLELFGERAARRRHYIEDDAVLGILQIKAAIKLARRIKTFAYGLNGL
jgi:hypothetical protein